MTLLGLFPGSGRAAAASEALDILLFLLGGLENLQGRVSNRPMKPMGRGKATDLERAKQALVHTHHGTGVVELAAIVGSAKQRDELTLREKLVAIFDNLVGAADEVHVVFLEEAGDDIGPEGEGDAAIIL